MTSASTIHHALAIPLRSVALRRPLGDLTRTGIVVAGPTPTWEHVPMPERLDRWARRARAAWPHAVACFVVFHIAASCVAALPDARLAMHKKDWREPVVRHELQLWADRLGTSRRALEAALWEVGKRAADVKADLDAPFRAYRDLTGMKQTWTMFVAGPAFQDRWQIRAFTRPLAEGHGSGSIGGLGEGDGAEILYERGDPERRWMAPIIESPRIRSAVFHFSFAARQKMHRRACRAFARVAFRERPDVTAIECRTRRTKTPSPRAPTVTVRGDEDRFAQPVTVRRRAAASGSTDVVDAEEDQGAEAGPAP
jgi:hypothetical protein